MEKLAVAIIPEKYTELFVSDVRCYGTEQIAVFSARGTAGPVLLQRLGLGTTAKSVISFLIPSAALLPVCSAWQKSADRYKDCTGILFTVLTENIGMTNKSEHSLICVIVNSGYGETVMQAARKAGAPGGTIIDARGTGTESDMNFFGIQIVPEKEVVLIAAENKTTAAITAEIKKLACFEKPGSGIMCTLPVDSCVHLGCPPA